MEALFASAQLPGRDVRTFRDKAPGTSATRRQPTGLRHEALQGVNHTPDTGPRAARSHISAPPGVVTLHDRATSVGYRLGVREAEELAELPTGHGRSWKGSLDVRSRPCRNGRYREPALRRAPVRREKRARRGAEAPRAEHHRTTRPWPSSLGSKRRTPPCRKTCSVWRRSQLWPPPAASRCVSSRRSSPPATRSMPSSLPGGLSDLGTGADGTVWGQRRQPGLPVRRGPGRLHPVDQRQREPQAHRGRLPDQRLGHRPHWRHLPVHRRPAELTRSTTHRAGPDNQPGPAPGGWYARHSYASVAFSDFMCAGAQLACACRGLSARRASISPRSSFSSRCSAWMATMATPLASVQQIVRSFSPTPNAFHQSCAMGPRWRTCGGSQWYRHVLTGSCSTCSSTW